MNDIIERANLAITNAEMCIDTMNKLLTGSMVMSTVGIVVIGIGIVTISAPVTIIGTTLLASGTFGAIVSVGISATAIDTLTAVNTNIVTAFSRS